MKKILAVDDDPMTLKLLGQHLSDAGYQVLTADNGREAFVKAREEHPDLILLDITMPGMDGGQTAQELKKDPLTKTIPVIFLTGILSSEEELSSGGVIGGNVFIAKPYDRQKLLGTIRKHLG